MYNPLYIKTDYSLLSSLSNYFKSIHLLMDCYTVKAAKASKYKNPINDVGVTIVYGYDDPIEIATHSHLNFIKEYDMTPQKYINELQGSEKVIFKVTHCIFKHVICIKGNGYAPISVDFNVVFGTLFIKITSVSTVYY